jgi:hypothetical protein
MNYTKYFLQIFSLGYFAFISFIFFIAFAFIPFNLSAQIVDDSTKQVYGAKTVDFFYEADLLEQNNKKHHPDTTLNNFHIFNVVQKNQNLLTDLGSWGTATRSIFYKIPSQIGTRLGIDVYQSYLYTPENIMYFDTKSPFTQANYVQGTTSDVMIDFLFSRNINKNWNFGFRYKRLTTNRQFGFVQSNTRLADHLSFVGFTHFKSKNEKYIFLYHFAHLNQMLDETGGVLKDTESPKDTIFGYRLSDARLGLSAESWQTQSNHHVFHQLRLDTAFTVFHTLDIQRQRDNYKDIGIQANYQFYPLAQRYTLKDNVLSGNYYLNDKTTDEGTIYLNYETKFGITGKVTKFNYIAYAKARYYQWKTTLKGDTLKNYLPNGTLDNVNIQTIGSKLNDGIELFAGGKLFYVFGDSTRLNVEGELQLGQKLNYRALATFYSKNIKLRYTNTLFKPTLIQNQYTSNHYRWENDFKNTLVQEFYGNIDFTFRNIRLSPYGSYTIILNHIYYGQGTTVPALGAFPVLLNNLAANSEKPAQPQQAGDDGVIQIFQAGVNLDVSLGKKLYWQNQWIYTEPFGGGLNLMPMPRFLVNSKVFCQDCLFKKYVESQFGVELHFKSDYKALSYMPITKQFYLQNDYTVPFYPIVDVFGSVRIGNFKIFAKFSHLNQIPNNGYVTTSIYPGQRRTFNFGVNWMFFN